MLSVYNRPAMKNANRPSSPSYSDEVAASRKELSEALTTLIQDHLEDSGAFVTPNNAGTGLMVALTLPVGALTFTGPDGNAQQTRTTVLNINASITTDAVKDEEPVGEEPAALSYDDLLAAVQRNKAAAKAAKK